MCGCPGGIRCCGVVETLMNLRSRLTGIATGDQGIFVRRELFERIGSYPADCLDGRHRPISRLLNAPQLAGLSAPAIANLQPALGTRWRSRAPSC
jgi:hypothetical protein